nr:hypothetical protein [Tanacetum cinerariifolium]
QGQARSPVQVGPEMQLQHMHMDPLALPGGPSSPGDTSPDRTT